MVTCRNCGHDIIKWHGRWWHGYLPAKTRPITCKECHAYKDPKTGQCDSDYCLYHKEYVILKRQKYIFKCKCGCRHPRPHSLYGTPIGRLINWITRL